MKNSDMVSALNALARRGIFVNHQECELVKSAAVRIREMEQRIAELERQAQVAIAVPKAGSAEAQAGEGFWEDMWPV